MTTATNDLQQSLELFAIHGWSSHAVANDVFAEIAIHLDNQRSREPRPGHDEVIP